MDRRVSLLPAWLGLAALLWLPGPAGAQEAQTWKNRDGDAVEAIVLDYDLETKMVKMELGNGSTIEYPLEDLDMEGRIGVLAVPAVGESLKEQGWKFPIIYLITVFLIVLGVLIAYSLTFGLFCFWLSARMVTGEPDFRFHLVGFLKYLGATIVLAVIGNIVTFSPIYSHIISGQTQFDPEAASRNYGLLHLFFAILHIVVPVVVLSFHYEIGFLRSFFTLFVYGCVSGVIGLILAIIALIVIAAGVPVVEQYGYGEYLLDEWFLKPIGIL